MAQHTTKRNIDSRHTALRALDMRRAGYTYEAIAEELGLTKAGAWKLVQRELKELTKEPARDLQKLELDRLDAMLLGIWDKASSGNLLAIDRALKIQERRARLLGLDAPDRQVITELDTKATPAEAKRIMRELAGNVTPPDAPEDDADGGSAADENEPEEGTP